MSDWHVLFVQGSEKSIRGFLAGFCAARHAREELVLGADLDLDERSFSQRVREFFDAGPEHSVLAPAPLAGALWQALRETGHHAGLRATRYGKVVAARLAFRVETYSPDAARNATAALEDSLPPGVSIEDRVVEEETDRGARGAELYAPAHEFVYRASGTFVGPLPGILEMKRRVETLDFAKTTPLELEIAEIERDSAQ